MPIIYFDTRHYFESLPTLYFSTHQNYDSVTFKRLLATSAATNAVTLLNTTVIFTSDVPISSVWNVFCAAGVSFTRHFKMASALTPNYQLSIYNQANAGTLITITAETFAVADGKLNLYSVTSAGSSSIGATVVTFSNSKILRFE